MRACQAFQARAVGLPKGLSAPGCRAFGLAAAGLLAGERATFDCCYPTHAIPQAIETLKINQSTMGGFLRRTARFSSRTEKCETLLSPTPTREALKEIPKNDSNLICWRRETRQSTMGGSLSTTTHANTSGKECSLYLFRQSLKAAAGTAQPKKSRHAHNM